MLVAAPAFVLLGALSLSSIMDIYAADLRAADKADDAKGAEAASTSAAPAPSRQKSKGK
jgi:hypothetical protein